MTRRPQARHSPRSLSEMLRNPADSPGGVLEHAGRLLELEQLLNRSLSTDLRGQFQVAALRQNRLILISPSASWATRLKMATPQILSILSGLGLKELQYVDVRIAPLSRQSEHVRQPKALTPAAHRALSALSALVSEDDVKSTKNPPTDKPDGG